VLRDLPGTQGSIVTFAALTLSQAVGESSRSPRERRVPSQALNDREFFRPGPLPQRRCGCQDRSQKNERRPGSRALRTTGDPPDNQAFPTADT
jgi:hypothetical protein